MRFFGLRTCPLLLFFESTLRDIYRQIYIHTYIQTDKHTDMKERRARRGLLEQDLQNGIGRTGWTEHNS
jgi:hypothetical protein